MYKFLIRAATAATLTLAAVSHAQAQTTAAQTPAAQPHGYMGWS